MLNAAEYFLHLFTLAGSGILTAHAVWLSLQGDNLSALGGVGVVVFLLLINLFLRTAWSLQGGGGSKV